MKHFLLSLVFIMLASFLLAQENVTINPDFLKKAEAGDPDYQYYVGMEYYYKTGFSESNEKDGLHDIQEAEKWLLKSADQGNVKAKIVLGGICEIAILGGPDYHKAVGFYIQAAQQGDVNALFFLNMYYSKGVTSKGTPISADAKKEAQDYINKYIKENPGKTMPAESVEEHFEKAR